MKLIFRSDILVIVKYSLTVSVERCEFRGGEIFLFAFRSNFIDIITSLEFRYSVNKISI